LSLTTINVAGEMASVLAVVVAAQNAMAA